MEKDCSIVGKEIAFTGRLASMTRGEAVERILHAGGSHVATPRPSTALLVAGEALAAISPEGRMARNLIRFKELKEGGAAIRLVEEREFLTMLGAVDELEDFSRLYTAAQVSRIVESPLSEVRSWLRHGLLKPARMTSRLAWFEYSDILVARGLSRLAAAGLASSEIRRGLTQLSRWLPGAGEALGRLDAAEAGLRVRMRDGGWAEPSGQRLLEFEPRPRALASVHVFPLDGRAPAIQFARALEAEEAGDYQAAASLYRLALEETRDAVTYFNLGNVLYELGHEAQAAESYLAAIALDTDYAEAWNNLGNALAMLGKLEDCLHAYRKALSLEPGYADVHCNLAEVLGRLGRHEEAAIHRTECLRAYPSERHLRLIREPFSDDAD